MWSVSQSLLSGRACKLLHITDLSLEGFSSNSSNYVFNKVVSKRVLYKRLVIFKYCTLAMANHFLQGGPYISNSKLPLYCGQKHMAHPVLFGPLLIAIPPIFRSVQSQYMTKIRSLRGRFQKVHVQFEDKGDIKMIDYTDIPLEDPDRFLYNLSSMQVFKKVPNFCQHLKLS